MRRGLWVATGGHHGIGFNLSPTPVLLQRFPLNIRWNWFGTKAIRMWIFIWWWKGTTFTVTMGTAAGAIQIRVGENRRLWWSISLIGQSYWLWSWRDWNETPYDGSYDIIVATSMEWQWGYDGNSPRLFGWCVDRWRVKVAFHVICGMWLHLLAGRYRTVCGGKSSASNDNLSACEWLLSWFSDSSVFSFILQDHWRFTREYRTTVSCNRLKSTYSHLHGCIGFSLAVSILVRTVPRLAPPQYVHLDFEEMCASWQQILILQFQCWVGWFYDVCPHQYIATIAKDHILRPTSHLTEDDNFPFMPMCPVGLFRGVEWYVAIWNTPSATSIGGLLGTPLASKSRLTPKAS